MPIWAKIWRGLDNILDALLTPEVGTATSIASLILTVWILTSIRSMRMHYLSTARVPQLLQDLQKNTTGLQSGITAEEWEEAVDIEMVKCRANLNNLAPKLRPSRDSINKVREQIDRYLGAERNKDAARTVYILLTGLNQELVNVLEDKKWSDPHAR